VKRRGRRMLAPPPMIANDVAPANKRRRETLLCQNPSGTLYSPQPISHPARFTGIYLKSFRRGSQPIGGDLALISSDQQVSHQLIAGVVGVEVLFPLHHVREVGRAAPEVIE
jgi:hypothetical protein